MQIRLAAPLQCDSIVDGEGIRTVIWTQGCSHHCVGCHNQGTWDFQGGFLEDVESVIRTISNLQGQDGITFSGGDPFFQVKPCLEIAKYCKEQGLNIWCYTGYTFEELLKLKNNLVREFLSYIDVLVDGKFILEQRSLDLTFKGSRNQRIIDVKKSLDNNETILVEKYCDNDDTAKKTTVYL